MFFMVESRIRTVFIIIYSYVSLQNLLWDFMSYNFIFLISLLSFGFFMF